MSKIVIIFSIITLLTLEVTCAYFNPDYEEALRLSLMFYESQRSGKLPPTNRIKWRRDSALSDRGSHGEDLTGGYYDASDFVKFSFTIAFTTTMLSCGLILYKDAYQEAGEYLHILEAIKWSTDYFIKCHVSPEEFYGQVGDFSIDHTYWGRPEDMKMKRPAYKIDKENPGSDLAGEASAAFSSSSIIFKDVNPAYSSELLRHAKELYMFAKKYQGLYQDVIPGAKQYYESTSYLDELAWAAIWLFKATNDSTYIEDAEKYYKYLKTDNKLRFFYNEKTLGIQALLAEATNDINYYAEIEESCEYVITKQLRTPNGLIFVDKFGTLSHAANIAFVCLMIAELPYMPTVKYFDFAKEQIDYILGAKGRSFVVGYGNNYPKRPYHVASSCPDVPDPCNWEQYNSTLPNPQILYGALVSGPDQNDHYEDLREEFLYNEVNLDYNAGYQSVLAGLIHFRNKE